jgi:anti-sigma regulatory factor (Ser/Thr protein kinase)
MSPPRHPGGSGGDGPGNLERWPLRSQLELGALAGAVPCARLHARQLLWEWGLAELAETAELLVSELVTNGVKASQAMEPGLPVRLRLSSDKSEVLIEVWDGNPRPPAPRDAELASEDGRGLFLVATLSERWNWHSSQERGGKVVWAVVAPGN